MFFGEKMPEVCHLISWGELLERQNVWYIIPEYSSHMKMAYQVSLKGLFDTV